MEDKKGGNNRLPFGLCERYKIPLPKGATPRQAWDALERELGITPEIVYREFERRAEGRPKFYRQDASYEEILAADRFDDIELPLIKEYIKQLTSDEEYLKEKERKERRIGLVLFAYNAINGRIDPKEHYVVSEISDRQRKDIERLTGDKLYATKNIITARTIIEHIERNHGANGKADRTMKDIDTYGEMADILMSYDSAELLMKHGDFDYSRLINRNGKKSKKIKFEQGTADSEKNYVVVEAVTDGVKLNEIQVVTMYLKKINHRIE